MKHSKIRNEGREKLRYIGGAYSLRDAYRKRDAKIEREKRGKKGRRRIKKGKRNGYLCHTRMVSRSRTLGALYCALLGSSPPGLRFPGTRKALVKSKGDQCAPNGGGKSPPSVDVVYTDVYNDVVSDTVPERSSHLCVTATYPAVDILRP